ncbi:MAG: hypothetical protein CVV27_18910 [Candidatus Melainabacteria bacterium HGW-Melainabacteria-1]|nr:MAG: hypothetical protein CVV27_18910 [Candidatus Melainabacteria bacterium HGW-Melainabacteria-1]
MVEAVDDSYVLVIDDDELIWGLIRDVLKHLGLLKRLKTFPDAEMALEFLHQQAPAPSCMVVDLHLPGMDGFGFLAQFEREFLPHFPNTEVYVVSASIRPEDRDRALAFPFVREFFIKPLRLAQLRKMLKEREPRLLIN